MTPILPSSGASGPPAAPSPRNLSWARTLSPEEVERLRSEFEALYRGLEHAYEPLDLGRPGYEAWRAL